MEHTVDKQKMEALQELAATNLKVSEAKNALFKLQSTETAYLEKREKQAIARVHKALEESQGLIKETLSNYEQMKSFSSTVSSFAGFLLEIYEKFQENLKSFDERSEEWDKNMKKQEEEIRKAKSAMKAEWVTIENDKKSIEKAQEQIKKDQMKLQDERGTLDRAIKRLKENRI